MAIILSQLCVLYGFVFLLSSFHSSLHQSTFFPLSGVVAFFLVLPPQRRSGLVPHSSPSEAQPSSPSAAVVPRLSFLILSLFDPPSSLYSDLVSYLRSTTASPSIVYSLCDSMCDSVYFVSSISVVHLFEFNLSDFACFIALPQNVFPFAYSFSTSRIFVLRFV